MKKFLVYGLSNNWGGIESIVMSMVSILSKDNKFDVIQAEGLTSYEDKYNNKNIRFLHIPAWGKNRKEYSNALVNLFLANQYDYVWINSSLMANRTIITITKKYSKARIITHSHGSSFEGKNKLKRLILLTLHKINRRCYYKNVDYPCMCSRKSGIWFYGLEYVMNNEVHYVKNGIDTEKYKYDESTRQIYRNQLGVKDKFVLFHAGRLTVVKNQQMILRIFADFHKSVNESILLIAGDGELRKELEQYSKDLGIIEQVRFLGNRDDIDKLYQAADVMMLPSFHEGFPVTLTEAQTSGLPCLVSDKVSDETNITGKVEFLSIERGDCEWVNALQKIKANPDFNRKDAVLKVRQEGFDVKTVCKEFINFLNK